MTQGDISILVLAAGASSRMRGRDKLLEQVYGQPLLRHVVQIALSSALPVTVALPVAPVARAQARRAAMDGLEVQSLAVDDASEGMAASLRAGVAALPASQAVLVLLADMPGVDSADLDRMITAYRSAPDCLHRACDPTGKAGHPVIFPPWAHRSLLALQGDAGAKALIAAHKDRLRTVILPMGHATTDLDTPEDWAAWRAAQSLAP